MQPDHRVHLGIIQRALLDHLAGSGGALLGGLEGEDDVAAQLVASLGEDFGEGQCDGDVAVVAAGVHHAGSLRAILGVADLLDGQRVDVGANQQRAPGSIASGPAQHADHALATHMVARLQPQLAQTVGDGGGGLAFLERKLRMRVIVAAHGGERGHAL